LIWGFFDEKRERESVEEKREKREKKNLTNEFFLEKGNI
jgi:hypothetical protein